MQFKKQIELFYGGLNKTEILDKLKSSEISLNPFAETIFSSPYFKVSKTSNSISLIIASIKGLGFTNGATYQEILNSLDQFGLAVCPLEVAPYLRFHLKDQLENNSVTANKSPEGSLTLFSKPLTEDESFPKGFYLRKTDNTLWLRGYRSSSDYIWDPNDELVFTLIDS